VAALIRNTQKGGEEASRECPNCHSKRIWKDGFRENNSDSVQRFVYRDCGVRFSEKSYKEYLTTENRQLCALSKEAKKLDTATETKTVAGISQVQQEVKGKIVEFSFWMLKQGYSKATIEGRIKLLKRMMKLGANFNDEESIKEIIAKQTWSISRKVNAVDAYDTLLRMQGKTWTPPIYKRVRTLPFIPTETELDQLIAGCSKRISTFLQLLKETGMRCGEACQLKWTDTDLVSNSVRVTPEKGGNPRSLRMSNKLVDMLKEMPNDTHLVFTYGTDALTRNFGRQRKRLALKLKNSRLNQITFHTFRHWKATMEYNKTKDILHVKEILGHKSINSTLLYTQLVNFKGEEFTARIAHTEQEACELVENGFEFVCDCDGNKIFRKRK
jgi:integrase